MRDTTLAAGLGSLVLLVEELRPHYKDLQAALALADSGGVFLFMGHDGERPAARPEGQHADHGEHADLLSGSGGLDPNVALGSVDFGALGDLSADFSAMDASFDAGGDGGGDGGGGD